MSIRSISLVAALVLIAAVMAVPAGAQTEVPVPPGAPTPAPGACTDVSKPSSTFTARAAKSAARTHVLRGTAKDVGCGVDKVSVSVSRKVGRACQTLTASSRFGRRTKCNRMHFIPVTGTTRWTFKLPKKLRKGSYLVRTQAVDFAGNVQKPRGKRIVIR